MNRAGRLRHISDLAVGAMLPFPRLELALTSIGRLLKNSSTLLLDCGFPKPNSCGIALSYPVSIGCTNGRS